MNYQNKDEDIFLHNKIDPYDAIKVGYKDGRGVKFHD